MGDIKLFKITQGNVDELTGSAVLVEKSLQNLVEAHSEVFLGVRTLASEYSTGKTHGGRIDTLGIDENGCPVIIEYKRAMNENVINQGLFYLDWLMDHQAEFKLLVMEKYNKKDADKIEWSSPRLLCIAGDFTKYDEHAVQQINRNIELIRYRKFSEELLVLELVNATTTQYNAPVGTEIAKATERNISEVISQLKGPMLDRYENLKNFMLALGDDVQMKMLKYYVAFKRIRNFTCVEPHPHKGTITLYVNYNPDFVDLETGYSRDVRNVGHYGTGDLEIIINSDEDLDKAKDIIQKSYEAS